MIIKKRVYSRSKKANLSGHTRGSTLGEIPKLIVTRVDGSRKLAIIYLIFQCKLKQWKRVAHQSSRCYMRSSKKCKHLFEWSLTRAKKTKTKTSW